jgi:hypothetical protein|tara:strand:+ start:63 stop:704 length:642 start_codon:yes stop_codon:yes gene_type:complete
MIIKTSAFEIPVYKTSMPNHKEIKEKFLTGVMPDLKDLPPNNIGLNLYSDYFPGLDRLDPEWEDLYTSTVTQFLKKAGFNQNKKWEVDVDLWYNVGIKGSFQEEHDHMGGFPGCMYSAIHFVVYDPAVHQPTTFYNPIHHTFLRNMQPCNGDDVPLDWQNPSYIPTVKEGDMLIFPSYLKHSVPFQQSDKIRATIALNLTIGNPNGSLFKKTL